MGAGQVLDRDAIRQHAEAVAGCTDWDDSEIVEPFARLTDALLNEARLSVVGVDSAGTRLRNLLTGYVQVQADAARHPEILAEEIGPPLVVIGLPRSGTTLLHALLAHDEQLRAPRWWEALYPSPPPDRTHYADDPRVAKVDAEFAATTARSPAFASLQPWSANLTAECQTLTQTALRSIGFTAYYDIPSYADWLFSADQRPLYRYHRRMLQQLQWRGPRGQWLIKSPSHFFFMDTLLEEYPGSVMFHTHRDPAETIPSLADMYVTNRALNTDHVDMRTVLRDTFDMRARGSELLVEFRRRRPEVQVVDVSYPDLVADPIGTVAAAYRSIGRTVSKRMECGMRQWLDDNARDKRPRHVYSLGDYGLTAASIRERFSTYLDAYGEHCRLSSPR